MCTIIILYTVQLMVYDCIIMLSVFDFLKELVKIPSKDCSKHCKVTLSSYSVTFKIHYCYIHAQE